MALCGTSGNLVGKHSFPFFPKGGQKGRLHRDDLTTDRMETLSQWFSGAMAAS